MTDEESMGADEELDAIRCREDTISKLALLVQAIWGHRCPMNEGGCACCAAWSVFDAMDRMTDTDPSIFVGLTRGAK